MNIFPPCSDIMRAMPKHSFNADSTAEDVLTLVERVIRDKTEFLNRLVALHGRPTIETIMAERQQALRDAQSLREESPTYKSKPPPKRQAG